ncbi:MAG: two-component system sensor histidine kinase BaeS [Gammaproteobacteria bacterium]|jgi:two-component system sensor histidine kinase BaeS
MRFTIKYKLFLTLFLATIVVVGSMVFLVKWSFERGFLEYVNKVEQEIHSNLVTNLAEAYKENGNWEFLRENPHEWKEIRRSSMPNPEINQGQEHRHRQMATGESPKGDEHETESIRRHRPPHFGKHWKGRECVLDENKDAVTHCWSQGGEMLYKVIVVDGLTVGYLGSIPRKKLSDGHDLQFSEQQHRFLLILGFCMALISLVLALPVARQLVLPINLLAGATRKLASGQYQTRIKADSSDELGDLSRDFNTLAMTLESNELARQQWIADISHELRTPLSILRGEIEALQDGIREVSTDRLDSLHNQVMNLNRLVNDLYELSMSDIGALNYQKNGIDVGAVLSRTIESQRDEFDAKQITLNFDWDGKVVQIFADSERLQQLFSNLLTNALRYTDAGGELQIELNAHDKSLLITMEDSAPGVALSDLPHLFERLYRVDNSRNRKTGGTGLGLAICKNIVDAHEGTITAETSSLGGLKISIKLPRD